MRRIALLALVALITLAAACAVGPRYHRPSLGLPDGWRPALASGDSLRRFYDSLRTSRDTLLLPGAHTAPGPVAYDTTRRGPDADSAAPLARLRLGHASVLRPPVATSP